MVMWINNYPKMIAESYEELLNRERRLRGSPLESRIKMLRLLKGGTYRSQLQLTEVLGYSSRQLGRWWKTYRRDGLDALLAYQRSSGRSEGITEEALDDLEEEMKQGNISTIREAREFLAERFSIHYKGVSGLSRLFKRHQIKLKTGWVRIGRGRLVQQAAQVYEVRLRGGLFG